MRIECNTLRALAPFFLAAEILLQPVIDTDSHSKSKTRN
jgi:hypothetical protein